MAKTYPDQTVEEYIESIRADRRDAFRVARDTVLQHLPEGFEEFMDFGMIVWGVPLETFPDTYNGHPLQYAALANQKNYMSLYLMGLYVDPDLNDWFVKKYREKIGRKPAMGKSCVRFRKIDNLPLDLVGDVIEQYSLEDYLTLYRTNQAS